MEGEFGFGSSWGSAGGRWASGPDPGAGELPTWEGSALASSCHPCWAGSTAGRDPGAPREALPALDPRIKRSGAPKWAEPSHFASSPSSGAVVSGAPAQDRAPGAPRGPSAHTARPRSDGWAPSPPSAEILALSPDPVPTPRDFRCPSASDPPGRDPESTVPRVVPWEVAGGLAGGPAGRPQAAFVPSGVPAAHTAPACGRWPCLLACCAGRSTPSS